MKTILNVALALFLPLSLAAPAAEKSAEQSPEAMVKQITDDVLDAIRKDKDLQSGDKKKALALAEEKVLPHLDFERMTQLAAGRNWNAATPAQREKLVAAFRAMLVRTYANSIDVYRGQTMTVVGANVPPGATEATVRNNYASPGRRPTPVDYLMRKKDGAWKIYDIVIDGISLVLTYRSQFDGAIRGSGIDGLIRQLQGKMDS